MPTCRHRALFCIHTAYQTRMLVESQVKNVPCALETRQRPSSWSILGPHPRKARRREASAGHMGAFEGRSWRYCERVGENIREPKSPGKSHLAYLSASTQTETPEKPATPGRPRHEDAARQTPNYTSSSTQFDLDVTEERA
jgi:hypothetical protein